VNALDRLRPFLRQHLVVRSPGRINLIGEHTDYNLGFVLPAAIDKAVWFAAAKYGSQYSLHALDFDEKVSFSAAAIVKEDLTGRHWSRYFRAVVAELQSRGMEPPPLEVIFTSDLPIGAGMSSSAAICCGFLFVLNEVAGWQLSRLEMASIAQVAEQRTGINCGIMDQFAVLHGRKDSAVLLDCRDLSHRYVPLKMAGLKLVLINSMVKHDLAATAYNDRRRTCEEGLSMLKEISPGMENLRDAGPLLPELKKQMPPADFKKIRFVMEENRRVLAAAEALEKNDWAAMGELLFQSHRGLSEDYEVSCSELDFLVETAAKMKGVLGARMMGGGFGGCTINLFQETEANKAVEKIVSEYIARTGKQPEVYEVKIEDGASRFHPIA
jgi:galactokinase